MLTKLQTGIKEDTQLIKEIQIKIIMRHHHTAPELLKCLKINNSKD